MHYSVPDSRDDLMQLRLSCSGLCISATDIANADVDIDKLEFIAKQLDDSDQIINQYYMPFAALDLVEFLSEMCLTNLARSTSSIVECSHSSAGCFKHIYTLNAHSNLFKIVSIEHAENN